MLEHFLPDRSAEDIFAGRIRLNLGGTEYVLPTLVIEDEEAWLAKMESSPLAAVLGNAVSDSEAVLALMASSTATVPILDALYAYDTSGVLPPREELRRSARPIEAVRALLEVWQAAHPLLGISLLGMQEMSRSLESLTPGPSPAPMSSPPTPMAGRRRKSARN